MYHQHPEVLGYQTRLEYPEHPGRPLLGYPEYLEYQILGYPVDPECLGYLGYLVRRHQLESIL